MTNNRRYINYNKAFTDYAYRFILTSREDQRANLSLEELKIFKDEVTIRKFCTHEPHDKIKLYLTKMGLTWIEFWCNDKEHIDISMTGAEDQYHYDQKRTDVIKAMAQEQVFATSSREMTLGYMLAQNSHSEVYSISATSKEIELAARKYKQRMESYDDQVNNIIEAHLSLNKLLLSQLNSFDWAKEALDLEQNDIRILSALFDKKNSAVTLQDIAEGTMLEGKKQSLKKNVENLEKKKLILSDKSKAIKTYGKQTYYMITGDGIKKIIKYRIHIHKMTYKK